MNAPRLGLMRLGLVAAAWKRAMTLLRLASAFGTLLALLAVAGSLSSVVQGGETWDGGGADSEWSTVGNWNALHGAAAPPNDGTADIIMAGTIKLSNQVDVDWDVNSLTFNNTAGAFSINGFPGVTLGIGAGGMSNNDTQLQTLLLPIGLNASQTWTAAAGPIILASGISSHPLLPRTLTLAGGFDITVAGSITNNMTLNKTGAGTLLLIGVDPPNTYAGSTSVTGGTLALNRTGGTDRAIPGNLTIGDGAGTDTVRLAAAEQITSAAGKLVTVHSSGVFNLNGFNETIRDMTLNGGSVTTNGGTLTVAGSLSTTGGSVTTNGGMLTVAGSLSTAGGTLQLVNNASVTSGSGSIGDSPGSNGQVTVSGAGATWTNSAELYVGNAGDGTLEILAGGDVSNTTGYLGNQPGSMGTVTVDGMGSTWTNSGDLYVGNACEGTLNIAGGGQVTSVTGYIADDASAIGEVTIEGVGSTWTSSGDLYVGNAGNGALNISSGSYVSDERGFIGALAGSTGSVTVDGLGSQWFNHGMSVGRSGDGTLHVSNGGYVTAGSANIGNFVGSTGAITVDGTGSEWNVHSNVDDAVAYVGFDGNGTLEITNGAHVGIIFAGFSERFAIFEIGRNAGSTGVVVVDGPGSSLEVAGTVNAAFRIGINGGHGTLHVTNGATVQTNRTLSLGTLGMLNISGGGQVTNHGGSLLGTATVDGTGSIWTNDAILGLEGTLMVTNEGMVQAATFNVAAIGLIRGDGNIVGNIVSNGEVRGNLFIAGNLQNNGLVSPGMSPGALNIEGDYLQTANGELLIELASASSYDQLLTIENATLGGTLTVNLLDDFVPSVGQSFTILTADDVDGTFTTEMLPTVPGRILDVIYNPQSVVLAVLPAFTADFDEDGDVDANDLEQWQGDFGMNALSDADNDGDSDGADFLAWQQQQGSGLPAAPTAVPEPSAIVLVTTPPLLLAQARRRSRWVL